MEPKEIFLKILLANNISYGIYELIEANEGSEILIPLHSAIQGFLNRSIEVLDCTNLHLYFLESGTINSCAAKEEDLNFVGINTGLIQYAYLIITSIFKENDFLPDLLGESNEEAPRYPYCTFESFHQFSKLNNTEWISSKMNPKNFTRALLANSVFEYFILFVIAHELAHVNQKNKKSILEFSADKQLTPEENLIRQVYEWDADLYAIEIILKRLMSVYNNNKIIEKSLIYNNKETICYFSIFIPLLMFYFLTDNGNIAPYTLEYMHPHPNVRMNYTSTYLAFIYKQSSFLKKPKIDSIGKRVVSDFKKVMQKMFPDAQILKYFSHFLNPMLKNHLYLLEQTGKQMGRMKCYGLND